MYPRSGFYGCCGAQTVFFGGGKVNAERLQETEQAARRDGFGVLIGIVIKRQNSHQVLTEAGWEKVNESGGRTGATLCTYVKTLKPPRRRGRKIVEEARAFA